MGGRAACISACVWTWAVPWCDVVLVHLEDTVRVPAEVAGHVEGGVHVSARYCMCIFGHGLGATGVGVTDGSSWPVTSVAVFRSPAQVGAGISSHLYHGRGGGWRVGVMTDDCSWAAEAAAGCRCPPHNLSEVGHSAAPPPLLLSGAGPRLSFRANGAGAQEASPGLAQTLRKDRHSPLLCRGLTRGVCFEPVRELHRGPRLESWAWK